MDEEDCAAINRLIIVEQLVLAGYELAEASLADPVVVGRLRRIRMQRLGTVSELLALVEASELHARPAAHRRGWPMSQDTALALLRQAEQRAASSYHAVLTDGVVDSLHEAFALRILDAQRAIDWFDRLARVIGRAPLA
ncbi:MAG: hypothetical protein JWM53_2881 [bacterium]|nr:hypothetical protein [bacterium]